MFRTFGLQNTIAMQLLQQTISARAAMKALGFKRGDYRIENERKNVYRDGRYVGVEYWGTYIYMHKPCDAEVIARAKELGLRNILEGSTYPIFK